VLKVGFILAIQEDFEKSASVNLVAQTLSDDLGWVDEIFEDSVVNSSESAAAWALLHFDVIVTVGLWQNTSLGNDHDLSAAEFLLQLSDESCLDFVVLLQKTIRDKNDNGPFAVLAH